MHSIRPSIEELKTFFATAPLPPQVQLYPYLAITDVPKFVESHLNIVESQSMGSWGESFYDRLVALQAHLLQKHSHPE